MAQRLMAWHANSAVYSVNNLSFPGYASQALTNVNLLHLDFRNNTDISVFYQGYMRENFSGGDVQVRLYWRVSLGATGIIKWQARILGREGGIVKEHPDAGMGDYTTLLVAPLPVGDLQIASITLPAATYPLAVGDMTTLQIRRNALDPQDTSNTNAQLLYVELREG